MSFVPFFFSIFLVRCYIKECAYSSHAKGEGFQRETDTHTHTERERGVCVCVFVRK